jgi:hypothetical protein
MKMKILKTIENYNTNHMRIVLSSSGNLNGKEVNKMFKKLLITGAAAGLLLVSATGAFADSHGTSITITGTGTVSNTVNTSSNTGYNVLSVSGGSVKDSGITTGAANSGVNLQNQVNFNQFSCGCVLGSGSEDNALTLKITGNGSVGNMINTSSNTGYNVLSAMGGSSHHEHGSNNSGVSGSWITTGAAGASSVVSNVVNTNVFGTTTP